MTKLINSKIPGCYEIIPEILTDSRGSFVKIFNEFEFNSKNLETEFKETYYSISHKGVVRGLHFQTPPFEHAKVVFCITGKVFDIVLDLRRGSPYFMKYLSFMLESEKANGLYIPRGCAHGFCALEDSSILGYMVTSTYSKIHDTGINPFSAGINWPINHAISSKRDLDFISLVDFVTPFNFLDNLNV